MNDPPEEPSPAQPEGEEAGPPAWEPPRALSDVISRVSIFAIRAALCGVGLLTLMVLFLWAIPTWKAARSEGFQALRAHALKDRTLAWMVGPPLTADRAPRTYRLGQTGGVYELTVRGALGSVAVRGEYRDGRVVDYRLVFGSSWRDAWERRRWSRAGDGSTGPSPRDAVGRGRPRRGE